MDIPLEPIRNLLAGAGADYVEVPMLDGEEILHSAVGNWQGITGGRLILTNRRLVFTPWDVADIATVLSWAVPKAGGPDFAPDLIDAAVKAIGGPRVAGSIVSARAGKSRALFHPPTLIASSADGEELEFGVLHDKLAPNIDARNEQARDEFVAAINGSR